MNKEDLVTLANIYNALLEVSTKGEDTMIMGECLKRLKSFILTKQNEIQTGGE